MPAKGISTVAVVITVRWLVSHCTASPACSGMGTRISSRVTANRMENSTPASAAARGVDSR